MTASFALLGSGEFDPWTEPVDRWLVGRAEAPGARVLILPTASAAEGDEVFGMWADKGLAHYRRLGIPASVLDLKTRADAERSELSAALADAAAVYFSGGNPAYLASTLAGTSFWAALLAALERGTAYAGCSAGVACLGDLAPDSSRADLDAGLWAPGLGLFPRTGFGPHWDTLDRYVPGLREVILGAVPTGSTFIGIDEDTAMTGDGASWTVSGAGEVHVLEDGVWTDHRPGEVFEQPLGVRS